MWQRNPNKSPSHISEVSFEKCPAKTFQTPDGTIELGRTVAEHCQIVGEVARALIERYPHKLRSTLFVPDAPFAAACHDIGKVSPCFFEKLHRACTVPTKGWAPLPAYSIPSRTRFHAEGGQHSIFIADSIPR